MNSVSQMIFFTAALLISFAVVLNLLPTVNRVGDTGISASQQIAESGSFCIESVYSDGTDTNVYVYGVSGSYRFQPRVYVDGRDVNVVSYGLIKDHESDGYLDSRDLGYVEINGNIFDGDLHSVEVWLGTDVSRATVLKNGDSGNCV